MTKDAILVGFFLYSLCIFLLMFCFLLIISFWVLVLFYFFIKLVLCDLLRSSFIEPDDIIDTFLKLSVIFVLVIFLSGTLFSVTFFSVVFLTVHFFVLFVVFICVFSPGHVLQIVIVIATKLIISMIVEEVPIWIVEWTVFENVEAMLVILAIKFLNLFLRYDCTHIGLIFLAFFTLGWGDRLLFLDSFLLFLHYVSLYSRN